MDLTGQKILVYGTGRSGQACAELIRQLGGEPFLYSDSDGPIPEDVLSMIPFAVISPGIPLTACGAEALRKRGIPVTGEIELSYNAGRGRVMAVTGTNGKTTTTALLGKIMQEHDPNTFIAGNIGIPYAAVAGRTDEGSTCVLEISSFQLETADRFHPEIASILNITPDHLDRHGSMEEYIRIKESVARRMGKDDTLILNYDDPVLREFAEEAGRRTGILFFSSKEVLPEGFYLQDDRLVAGPAGGKTMIRTGELQIIGTHNFENALAAGAMAYAAGVPLEEIRASMASFQAVPHRIELIGIRGGVRYYNDSKATNPDAAIKGIHAMQWPTFLIGGGYDKGSDYSEWIGELKGRIKGLLLIGETAEDIRRAALAGGIPEDEIVMAGDLASAFAFAAEHAAEGDAVLLSPACASWDQFKSYEKRGEAFRAYVEAL